MKTEISGYGTLPSGGDYATRRSKDCHFDGVVMEGNINGSKLKRFYGPLTLHALQTIHSNQRRKKEEKLAQQRARQEAKERELKEKSKRMTLYFM